MDFRQLTTFTHVARLGSLSKAAERLRIAQPALSRQIRLLEDDLQVSLFDRHGRGMTLTEAGEHLFARVGSLLRQMDELRAEMPARGKEVRGRVCLGVPPTVGDVIAARLIERFHALYPSVALRVVPAFSGYLLDFLHRGEVDLAIIYGASRRPDIDLAPLVEEQLYLVAPKALGLSADTPVPLSRVAEHKLILPSAQHGLRVLIDEASRNSDLRLNVPIEVDALQTLKDLVIQKVGLTILPLASVVREIEAGLFSVAPISRPQLRRSLILANHTGRPMSKAIRLFRDMLLDEMSFGGI